MLAEWSPVLSFGGFGAPLGEGGFGTVWTAEQIEPIRRIVALKVIKETVYGIIRSPEYQAKIQEAGYVLPPKRAMDDFKGFVEEEYKRWGPIVKKSGATLE